MALVRILDSVQPKQLLGPRPKPKLEIGRKLAKTDEMQLRLIDL